MSSHSDNLDNVRQRLTQKIPESDTSSAIRETYLSHPVFGMLTHLCILNTHSALYTSLYAKRMFFQVTTSNDGLRVDSINQEVARVSLERRLAVLQQSNFHHEYEQLREIYISTFNR